MASNGKAVTGTAVMARSANEEKKKMFGIPNSPRSLDLDDRQGFIASSAMQPKKKKSLSMTALRSLELFWI